jgi:hypothetical protein
MDPLFLLFSHLYLYPLLARFGEEMAAGCGEEMAGLGMGGFGEDMAACCGEEMADMEMGGFGDGMTGCGGADRAGLESGWSWKGDGRLWFGGGDGHGDQMLVWRRGCRGEGMASCALEKGIAMGSRCWFGGGDACKSN